MLLTDLIDSFQLVNVRCTLFWFAYVCCVCAPFDLHQKYQEFDHIFLILNFFLSILLMFVSSKEMAYSVLVVFVLSFILLLNRKYLNCITYCGHGLKFKKNEKGILLIVFIKFILKAVLHYALPSVFLLPGCRTPN